MKENPMLTLIQHRLDLAREVLADANKLLEAQGSPSGYENYGTLL